MNIAEYAHGCVIEIERDNRHFEVHFSEAIHDDRLIRITEPVFVVFTDREVPLKSA